MFVPILDYLNQYAEQAFQWRKLERPIADHFNLTEEDLALEYASGNGTVFLDRLSWSISFLVNAGLVQRPKRGVCQITAKGQELIETPQQIDGYMKDFRREYQKQRHQQMADTSSEKTAVAPVTEAIAESDATPSEQLNNAYEAIRSTVCEQILDTILSKSPYEFEKLVVSLLDRMGYGGKVADAAQVTKASGDGGIDGIIKEDVLGLGRIHLQAKRYKRDNGIGREDIQKFVGALAVAQSQKGVFITTSYFTKEARNYVANLNGITTIVLIDGEQLAGFIYDYGLGMQEERALVVKKMDADYWDDMLDSD
nr:restriction endonuclease [Oceanobacter mangrovi]